MRLDGVEVALSHTRADRGPLGCVPLHDRDERSPRPRPPPRDRDAWFVVTPDGTVPYSSEIWQITKVGAVQSAQCDPMQSRTALRPSGRSRPIRRQEL